MGKGIVVDKDRKESEERDVRVKDASAEIIWL